LAGRRVDYCPTETFMGPNLFPVVVLGLIVLVIVIAVTRRRGTDDPGQAPRKEPHQAPTPVPTSAATVRRPPRLHSPTTPRLNDLPIGDDVTFDVGLGGDCSYGIVGESNYQGALRRLDAGRRRRGEQVRFIAELVLEPDNPFDANAVKVVATTTGEHLGYLAREDGKQYQMGLKAVVSTGKRACCRAKLIGGSEGKPSLGVMIDLREADDLLSAVEPQPF
jgi:hypothetical protein